MRVFAAAFYSETNTFSPLPTGWSSFREQMLHRPGEHPDSLHEVSCLLWLCRRRARTDSWDVIEGTCAHASPGGPVPQVVYESVRDGILSISVVHGCDVGDVPDMGTKILVVTDDRPALGARVAERLGRELFALRGRSSPHLVSVEEALERACRVEEGPVILADMGDVPGGGAPGDATFLLRAILERGIRDVCATLYDPMAVRIAFDAEILHVDSPGALVFDVRKAPYRNVVRPRWPFDEDPLGDVSNEETSR